MALSRLFRGATSRMYPYCTALNIKVDSRRADFHLDVHGGAYTSLKECIEQMSE
jgi:hypothetical protein